MVTSYGVYLGVMLVFYGVCHPGDLLTVLDSLVWFFDICSVTDSVKVSKPWMMLLETCSSAADVGGSCRGAVCFPDAFHLVLPPVKRPGLWEVNTTVLALDVWPFVGDGRGD